MKAKVCLFLLLSFCVLGIASAAEFGYPVEGEPWYFIKAAFTATASLSEGTWRVSRITVNGSRSRDFLLYQGGEEVPGNSIRGQQPFEAKIRHSWQGNQSYEIGILLENAKTRKTATLTQKLSSPALKGYWNPGVYSPPHTWTHTSDWESPAFVEVSGPVFYSIRITAPLPHYPQVLASITYHFYAKRRRRCMPSG